MSSGPPMKKRRREDSPVPPPPPPPPPPLPEHRYALVSPTMAGKTLDMFRGKQIVYLVRFVLDGCEYLKFGCSREGEKRHMRHMASYPGAQIYCILETSRMNVLENAFRARMRNMGHLVSLDLPNPPRREKEILKGISAPDAERVLRSLWAEVEEAGAGATEADVWRQELRVRALEARERILAMLLPRMPPMALTDVQVLLASLGA